MINNITLTIVMKYPHFYPFIGTLYPLFAQLHSFFNYSHLLKITTAIMHQFTKNCVIILDFFLLPQNSVFRHTAKNTYNVW